MIKSKIVVTFLPLILTIILVACGPKITPEPTPAPTSAPGLPKTTTATIPEPVPTATPDVTETPESAATPEPSPTEETPTTPAPLDAPDMDYSGTYLVDMPNFGLLHLVITQSETSVIFLLQPPGSNMVGEGSGTAAGNNMVLNGTVSTLGNATLELNIEFSPDGESFSGIGLLDGTAPFDLTGNDAGEGGQPRFVTHNYIELDKIRRISKFRSGIGHDYSDEAEPCRSMKHYFEPFGNINWASVNIFAPTDGTIVALREEQYRASGIQVQIQSRPYPSYTFIIFHVDVAEQLNVGDEVSAGQLIGNHVGKITTSDIAVLVDTQNGWVLISYFDVMIDTLFGEYEARGLGSRNAFIISREDRDDNPLTCNGEQFANEGTLDNWVVLD